MKKRPELLFPIEYHVIWYMLVKSILHLETRWAWFIKLTAVLLSGLFSANNFLWVFLNFLWLLGKSFGQKQRIDIQSDLHGYQTCSVHSNVSNVVWFRLQTILSFLWTNYKRKHHLKVIMKSTNTACLLTKHIYLTKLHPGKHLTGNKWLFRNRQKSPKIVK